MSLPGSLVPDEQTLRDLERRWCAARSHPAILSLESLSETVYVFRVPTGALWPDSMRAVAAAPREDVPRLVAAVRALRAERAMLRDLLRHGLFELHLHRQDGQRRVFGPPPRDRQDLDAWAYWYGWHGVFVEDRDPFGERRIMLRLGLEPTRFIQAQGAPVRLAIIPSGTRMIQFMGVVFYALDAWRLETAERFLPARLDQLNSPLFYALSQCTIHFTTPLALRPHGADQEIAHA
jgi:hypothetical protein